MSIFARIGSALLMLAIAIPSFAANPLRKWKEGRDEKKAEEILATNYVPQAEWEGYFKDEQGRTKMIRQPIEMNPDEDWVGLVYTPYTKSKMRLAVMKIENRTAFGEQTGIHWDGVAVNVAGIENFMSTALMNTGRFDLTERKDVDKILYEQDFGASGRVATPSAAKIGQILGAPYILYGVVNEWAPEVASKGIHLGSIPVIGGSLGVGKKEAQVTMTFSVADATTGKVIFQETHTARTRARSIGVGTSLLGAAGGIGTSENSPISSAVRACVNKAAYALARKLPEPPWRGSVVKVAGNEITINAGKDKGMQVGSMLTVLSKGEDLIDPETGTVLEADVSGIGSLSVVAVRGTVSVASIVEGCQGIKIGDRVELANDSTSPSATSSVGQR